MPAAKYRGVGTYTRITSATTTQITTKATFLERVIVVAGTVDIYDDPDSNDNAVVIGVTASQELGAFLNNGLRVVTTGATPNVTVIYSTNRGNITP